jgi:hypothetical protein
LGGGVVVELLQLLLRFWIEVHVGLRCGVEGVGVLLLLYGGLLLGLFVRVWAVEDVGGVGGDVFGARRGRVGECGCAGAFPAPEVEAEDGGEEDERADDGACDGAAADALVRAAVVYWEAVV